MAAEPEFSIPVLTERVGPDGDGAGTGREPAADAAPPIDKDELIAELQTEIAASTFTLTDEILRSAFAEMEASIFEQISGRLRRELPDMIDTLLRERLGDESDV